MDVEFVLRLRYQIDRFAWHALINLNAPIRAICIFVCDADYR